MLAQILNEDNSRTLFPIHLTALSHCRVLTTKCSFNCVINMMAQKINVIYITIKISAWIIDCYYFSLITPRLTSLNIAGF